jgi:1-acyl-sn-glycerol-3-phosphate acyltransferase
VENSRCIPQKGPFILASNHLSNLDPPVLAVACPRRICFLAKEELFKNTLVKLYFKAVGALPLKRAGSDIKALRTALETLKDKPLLVFPQGTRRQDFNNISPGVGFLARKAKVPVVAARIYGSDKVLPKGKKRITPGKIRVVFGIVENLEYSDSKELITEKVIAVIRNL